MASAIALCVAHISLASAATINAGQTVQRPDGATTSWDIGTTLYVNGTLNIFEGGTVTNTIGYVGQNASNGGTVTVQGPDAVWTNSGALYAGYYGNASLTISNGGSVSSTIGSVAYALGSSANALITGQDSVWTSSSTFSVGYRGTGELTVSDGGKVVSGSGIVGNSDGSGTVLITGQGSAWNAANAVTVGYSATGVVTINDGGQINSRGVIVGNNSTSLNNVVSIAGPDSRWTSTGEMRIGYAGSATLTVSDGGALSNTGMADIANANGSEATVRITDPGSVWTNDRDLYVGRSGSGTLIIENGGAVTSVNSYIGNSSGSATGVYGTVEVDGPGSSWINSGALAVASGTGTGSMTISNGAKVQSATGSIAINTSVDGTVLVDGAGSSWIMDGLLYAGGSGKATLTIRNGGLVSAGAISIGNAYVADKPDIVTVAGAGSRLVSGADLQVAVYDIVTLRVEDGGSVESVNAYLGNIARGIGMVTVDGAGSRWYNSGNLYIGAIGTGTFDVTDGAEATVDGSVTLASAATANGTLNVGSGGTLQTQAIAAGTGPTARAGFDGGNLRALGDNDGFISGFAPGGLVIAAGGVTVDDAGHSIGTDASAFSGVGGLTKTGAGTFTLNGANTYGGPTQVSSGILAAGVADAFSASSGVTVTPGATLDLDGYDQTVASLASGGVVRIGSESSANPVGTVLTVSGPYQSNGGDLLIRTVLGDSTSRTDRLVAGDVSTGTGGATALLVTNVGGTGALTTGDGIEVVSVTNGSSTDAFTLGRPLVAGEYEYLLQQGSNQGWYLASALYEPPGPDEPGDGDNGGEDSGGEIGGGNGDGGGDGTLYNPSLGAYLGNQTAAVGMFMHGLYDRRHQANGRNGHMVWGRIVGGHSTGYLLSDKLKARTEKYLIHLGGDLATWEIADGSLHVGLMGAYGKSKTTSTSRLTGTWADGRVDGYSLGVYGSWFADETQGNGLYIDGWLQHAWFDNEVSGVAQVRRKERYDARLWTASLEAGYGFVMEETDATQLMLAPHLQVAYNRYDADTHFDGNQLVVSGDKADGFTTRLGARLYGRSTVGDGVRPYAELNWLHHGADNGLVFNGEMQRDGTVKNLMEIKAGIAGAIGHGWTLWAEGVLASGSDRYHYHGGQLGIKYQW